MRQDTEWVIVAVYSPAITVDGTDTLISGFQAAEVLPATLVALTTACGAALSVVAGTKVKVADPVAWLRALML
jgi:hypothetical protein